MEQQMYTVMDYKEASALVGEIIGKPDYEELVPDMGRENSEWKNDTDHAFLVEPPDMWIHPSHENCIADSIERGYPKWNFELSAILDELAAKGKIPLGNLLITVCW